MYSRYGTVRKCTSERSDLQWIQPTEEVRAGEEEVLEEEERLLSVLYRRAPSVDRKK